MFILLISIDEFIPGQISGPLDPDIDWDGAMDGIENNENVLWFEAEEHGYTPNQIIDFKFRIYPIRPWCLILSHPSRCLIMLTFVPFLIIFKEALLIPGLDRILSLFTITIPNSWD